jgi:uncharacterized membrane protein YvbJ
MAKTEHASRICTKCGGRMQMDAEACSWCGTSVGDFDGPQRIRVRKKRNVLKTYYEHIRRHRIYFLLAILAALAAAWLLLRFAQRPSRQGSPSPASITLLSSSTVDL